MTRLSLVALLTLSTLAFSQQPEGDAPQSYPCQLQGLKQGRLTITPSSTVELFDGKKRLASAEIPDHDFNPAKGEVKCEGTKISLSSQLPYKATSQTTELTWAQGGLKAGETRIEDPSLEALAEAEKELKAGNIEAAIEQLGSVLYPHQYYDEFGMAKRILLRAHEVAGRRYKEQDKVGAAKVMEQAFEHFSAYSEPPEGSQPVPAARLTAIRNDYGFFLAEAGRSAEAEKVLREVVEAAPDRAVARLNLADALWAQGKKTEAEAQYREYTQRIPRKKWPATLLKRCPKCASGP
jgi:tetratricopeptide (TPR) repeat protein